MNLKLATYPAKAGTVAPCGDPFVTVTRVDYEDRSADIVYQKYTRDYRHASARPYVLAVSRRQFATLPAAVAALKKERHHG